MRVRTLPAVVWGTNLALEEIVSIVELLRERQHEGGQSADVDGYSLGCYVHQLLADLHSYNIVII